MNKEVLRGAFTKGGIFEYKCPHCYNGLLRLSGDFNSQETEESLSHHGEEWWDFECVSLVFSCTLKCSTCKELVFMVGNGVVDIDHDVDEDGEWVSRWTSFYTPTFFHPPLQLIDYPPKAPKEVIAPLVSAGALYFTSPSSCCNSIRAAAELVLSALGVAVKGSDDKWISFGNRINLLADDIRHR